MQPWFVSSGTERIPIHGDERFQLRSPFASHTPARKVADGRLWQAGSAPAAGNVIEVTTSELPPDRIVLPAVGATIRSKLTW
jgi:hypothetical protein